MHDKLQYRRPPDGLFSKLKPEDIAGEYEHTPRQNDWHVGKITIVSAKDGKLKWTNEAGRSWSLIFVRRTACCRPGVIVHTLTLIPLEGARFAY